MLNLRWQGVRQLLCLGAHADDIEIGCGGAILRLMEQSSEVVAHWVVFSADEARSREAQRSAARFLHGAAATRVDIHSFRDAHFPAAWAELKEMFDRLGRETAPDLIFTHRREDQHQDHRLLAELTWQTFRRHTILEYEIPKYEGDLGHPNLFVTLTAQQARTKAELIEELFPTQHSKSWFSSETLLALARLRGMECHAPEGYAEGFYARKLVA